MAAGPGGFWDALRAWADGAGLLQPQDPQDGPRPRVPQAVCDNCPICQGAATLDQVNPDVVHELADLARGVLLGLGSALSSAADQRLGDPGAHDALAPDEDDDVAPDEQDDTPDGQDDTPPAGGGG